MTSSHRGGSWEMQRRYSVPPNAAPGAPPPAQASAGDAARMAMGSASEDLHAWSIYRQNLNSDFTDSALGSTEKSPLPYGNFQLRDSTVQSILAHPRYGPKSALGSNMYTYLKFGLPRVFPPSRGGRDGSSGYDSSEDGSARRHHGRYLRARSDPDFRSQRPRGHEQQWAKPADRGWSRGKSRSEANLLHAARAESQAQSQPHPAPAQMRRSLHDLRAPPSLAPLPAYLPPPHEQRSTRRSSKGSSHHIVVGNGPDPGLEEDDDPQPSYRHPHLQCMNLAVEDSNGPLLSGVTMETFGGDVTAVMATSEEEGTALLEALSGRHHGKVRGQRLLNGRPVRDSALRDRVAYSRAGAEMAQDLTVAQTLRMARWLRSVKPADKGQIQDRTTALLEELGLAQVSHTSVSRLTASERSRLHVGCQLALDAALVTLDRPTRGMDIFDTFFLVEFLRQWASSRGAVVMLTLHPPTYEVFTMLSRVVLLSAGRTMFAGRTRAALPFFAACDFPCPAFKNPADYYLDLVTLDDLSAEAMLESSQRIAALAEAFQRRQPALAEPGPPVALPPKIRHASFPTQCIAIATRAAVFSQPLTLVRWFALALLAALTSLALGAVFFALPATDPTLRLSDRLGLVNALTLGSWPLMLLLVAAEVKREHRSVQSDIADRLYSRTAYFLTKTLVNLPMCACVWLAYLLPALIVSGLHPPGSDAVDLYLHLGYWLLHLLAIQQALTFLALACSSRLVAGGIALVLMSALSLASGQWLHPNDLHWPLVWLRMVSPQRWLLTAILPPQHSTHALALAALTCRSKQVQHQDIIVQLPCPAPDGAAALRWAGLAPDSSPAWLLATAPAAFWLAALLLGGGAFLVRRLPRHVTPPRNNPNKP